MKSEYINFLLSSPKLSLSSYATLIIEGRDSERFLNGQLTNDLKKLQDGQFQYSSRLDRAGKVISFGILKKLNNESFVFISKEDLADALKTDLEKFIIMDEVEVKKSNKKYDFVVSDTNVSGFLIGEPGYLEESKGNSTEKNEFFDILSFIRAEPFCILENTIGKFVNESILNNIAVSYSKGCFLGQETVAKIENNRGAAWYPMLVETNLSELENKDLIHNEQSIAKILDHKNIFGQNYFLALVKREFRIDRKSMGEYTLRHIGIIPRFENKDERVEYLYELAVETFQEGDEELSMRLLDYIIANYPHHADSYEIYGVILGRNNQYEKAISKMDKLLEVNPESVMAHTNKSLFYMKMGNIEEAEKEKSEATFKSFSQFGKDAEVKKKQEEAILKEKEELERKKAMFLQVLEIDKDDVLANFGLAEYFLKKLDHENSLKHSNIVLAQDDKYSVAYLIKGKSLEGLERYKDAIDNYLIGIEVAGKKGDLMPANEMQTRLIKLQSL